MFSFHDLFGCWETVGIETGRKGKKKKEKEILNTIAAALGEAWCNISFFL